VTHDSHFKEYGDKLDVIYDEIEDYSAYPYSEVIFWNGTVLTP